MKRFTLTIAFLASFCAVASAQHFDPQRRHSIEISTGNAPLHSMLAYDNSDYIGPSWPETTQETTFITSLNIGYSYDISETWAFNGFLNFSGRFYDNISWEYDWHEEEGGYRYATESYELGRERRYEMLFPTIGGDFRWKFYRTDFLRLYMAVGFGLNPTVTSNIVPLVPLPYLTPIGISFGKGRVYGIGEITMSPAATLMLIGIGYRL